MAVDTEDHFEMTLTNRRFFVGPVTMFLTGAMALVPVLAQLRQVVAAVPSGFDAILALVTVPKLLVVGLFLGLAAIGFSPKLQQRFLRRRDHWASRVLMALVLVAVFALIFLIGAAMAKYLGETKTLRALYLLAGLPLLVMLIYAFVTPGRYAEALAARHERDTTPPSSGGYDDPADFGGPAVHGNADAEWREGAAHMADVRESWRARVMTRHGAETAAEAESGWRKSSRKNAASRKPSGLASVLRIILAIPVLILAAGVIHAQIIGWFMPVAWLDDLSHKAVIPTTVSAGVIGLALAVFSDRRAGSALSSSAIRFVLLPVFCAGLAWFFAQVAIAQGLPALYARAMGGSEITIAATVEKIGPARVRRGCDRVIYLKGSGRYASEGIRLCEVGADLHSQLSPGQSVRLTGIRSDYGVRITALRPGR